jgi:hypothetical protein
MKVLKSTERPKFVTVPDTQNVHSFFTQTVGKLLYVKTNGKLRKNGSLKYIGSQITPLTSQRSVGG